MSNPINSILTIALTTAVLFGIPPSLLAGEDIHQWEFPVKHYSIPLSGNEYSRFIEPEISAMHSQALNEASNTPNELLHLGILHDSPDEISDAIARGANLNEGKENKAPLLYAVLLKKSKAVESLIGYGANVNLSYSGLFLAQHSVKLGDLTSAITIIRHGGKFSGDMDAINRNIMDYAINYVEMPPYPYSRTDALKLVEELILRGYNIHSPHWKSSVWYSAIRHTGRTEAALQLFVKHELNPNQIIDTSQLILKSSWTPLLRAVYHFNYEAIKILLAAGADINQKANPYPHQGGPHSPLSFALKYTSGGGMVEFLIENGASL